MANLFAALTVTIALVGCDGAPPYQLAPAHGHVTLDGQPMTGAKVMFAPVAKGGSIKSGRPAFGMLRADGAFTLGTYAPEDGAVVGEHWVTVIRMPAERGRMPGARTSVQPASESIAAWDRIVYPQKLTVAADRKNDFAIPLTSDIIARYGQTDD